MDPYLEPAPFLDSDDAAVVAFARDVVAGADTELAAAVQLNRAVRDKIRYDAYVDVSDPENFRASGVLKAGRGFCIGKASLLAACARAVGIRAGVGYADVKNHMTSPRLYNLMQSDLFVWHSFADICVDGVWRKATPTFDRVLCERLGIAALEFDGESDSLLHPFDKAGRRHMEYVQMRGTFSDVPFAAISSAFRERYPRLYAQRGVSGDFGLEATVPDQ